MLRHILFVSAALALASSAFAQDVPRRAWRSDGFVISGDACGASAYQHLVGQQYARLYQAALVPAGANLVDRVQIKTLEYRPERLNFVLGGDGRLIAVGCF